jgi:hypothetical protein
MAIVDKKLIKCTFYSFLHLGSLPPQWLHNVLLLACIYFLGRRGHGQNSVAMSCGSCTEGKIGGISSPLDRIFPCPIRSLLEAEVQKHSCKEKDK